MRRFYVIISLMLLVALAAYAQPQKSSKRGMGWDEKNQTMSQQTISKMAQGVSWIYNWAVAPSKEVDNLGPGKDVEFVPMCWNGNFNETSLRNYLAKHPGVKYLLGFNEPNFSSQSNMTPAQAVAVWPKLEKIAVDYGLELVAPALNFTGEKVGGRTWEPYEWYDEFFRLYPSAQLDYLAFHCYMNWAENVDWICSRYFYGDADLFSATKKADYPNLVAYLEKYKSVHGHFPRMFLTEFCSWEGNVYPYWDGLTVDFQIDQMTQKLQYMELSDLVAGYAWFMANPKGGASEFPYESVFQSNTMTSDLSTLGKVYVNMSSFDRNKSYVSDETILAKDYVNASMDDKQVKLRPNTEPDNDIPLQVELPKKSWVTYLTEPVTGETTITLHMKSTANTTIIVYGNGFKAVAPVVIPSTNGNWEDRSFTVELPADNTELTICNNSASCYVNKLWFSTLSSGVDLLLNEGTAEESSVRYYNMGGQQVAPTFPGLFIERATTADGKIRVRKMMRAR